MSVCMQSKAIDQVHVDFLITLVLKYSPLCCLQMAHQALRYLATLPDNKSGRMFLVKRWLIIQEKGKILEPYLMKW